MPASPHHCPRWGWFALAYVLTLALLNLPSALLWLEPNWRLVTHESDWFLGQAWAKTLLGDQAYVIGRTLHTVLFLLAGALFARLVWHWLNGQETPSRTAVTWTVAGASLVSLAGLPWVSPDVFYYLAKGWVWMGYEKNPYLVNLAQIPLSQVDPLFRNVQKDFLIHNLDYGPFFQWLVSFPVWLAAGSPQGSLILFKLMMTAAVLTTGWVAAHIALALDQPTSHARLAFFATVANPVTLFALITCAHNDALIGLCIAGAIWAALAERWQRAGTCLGLGVCIKYIPLLLFPVLLLFAYAYLSRHYHQGRWRACFNLTFGFVLSIVVLHSVFPHSWSNFFELVGGGFHVYRNNHYFLAAAISLDWASEWHGTWMLVGRVLFLLLCLVWFIRWWLKRDQADAPRLIQQSLAILIAYLLLASIAIHEWYFAWWLPLAFVLPDRALWRSLLVLLGLFPALVIWSMLGDGTIDVGVNLLLYALCGGLTLWYLYRPSPRESPREPPEPA